MTLTTVQSVSIYEAVEERINRLSTRQDSVYRVQFNRVLSEIYRLEDARLCSEHFISCLQTFIRTEASKHCQDSKSREALEVCLVTIQWMDK